jgi:hypothetical protein
VAGEKIIPTPVAKSTAPNNLFMLRKVLTHPGQTALPEMPPCRNYPDYVIGYFAFASGCTNVRSRPNRGNSGLHRCAFPIRFAAFFEIYTGQGPLSTRRGMARNHALPFAVCGRCNSTCTRLPLCSQTEPCREETSSEWPLPTLGFQRANYIPRECRTGK